MEHRIVVAIILRARSRAEDIRETVGFLCCETFRAFPGTGYMVSLSEGGIGCHVPSVLGGRAHCGIHYNW